MRFVVLLLLLFAASTTYAADHHVDAASSRTGDGSQSAPFRTITEAAHILKPGDTCIIHGGVYHETVRPANSGTADKPIIFRAAGDTPAVIMGADPVPNTGWRSVSGNIWAAKITLSLKHENQVFRGRSMMVEARWPNVGEDLFRPGLSTMNAETTMETIRDAELPDWDFTGAHVWIHAAKYWSNWTTKIEAHGKGFLQIENVAPYKGSTSWHVAKEGAEYFIFGCRDALDADNEWYYDDANRMLYVYSVASPQDIFVKRRMAAVDLQNKSYITLEGLNIIGAAIETNDNSSHIIMDGLRIRHPYHSSQANRYFGTQTDKGILLNGSHSVIRNSEISHSSGCGVVLDGEYNQVINCYIHDTDYIGTYASCVQLRGKGNVVSHCTLNRSGRTVLDYGNMYQAVVQYNDMSHSGLLTSDLGLTYGNIIEGGNSEIRYNWLHDNLDEHLDMGLYYDHGTQNIISHHNVVWGVGYSAFQINHYAYYHLAYNNTFSGDEIGFRSAWGNKYTPDLHGCRFFNNIFAGECFTTAGNYAWGNNATDFTGLVDYKYLPPGSNAIDGGMVIPRISEKFSGKTPDLGAYENGEPRWSVGHDFANPPVVDATRSLPEYRNLLVNTAFEHEDHLRPWIVTGGQATPFKGNKSHTTPDTAQIRMGHYSMELGPGNSEISQIVTGLQENTWYEFAGWLRVDGKEKAFLGVRNYGGEERTGSKVIRHRQVWTRSLLQFKTGANESSAQVFVRRLTEGDGRVYADDFGLVKK
jgi:hypothetical protein